MEMFDYREARRYAMQLGLKVAGTWIISFLMFVYLFPSMVSQLAYLVGLSSIALAGIQIRRYRQQEESLTMLRCWWVSWFTYMCCALLTTAAQYIYFAWFDQGRLMGSMANLLASDEIREVYTQMQATDLLENLQRAVEELAALPVKELVMSLMSTNMILGLIFSILTLLCLIGSQPGEKGNERMEE